MMDKDTSRGNRRPPTNEDTVGPYFPIPFCDDDRMDLTIHHEGLVFRPSGQRIVLRGRLLDRHGMLANGALIEFWQPNAAGVYRTPATVNHPDIDPWFDGYARCRSVDGTFALKTIKPGRSSEGERAPNITVTIFSDGISRIVTQIFFADEPSNEADPLLLSLPPELRPRLMARHDGRQSDGSEVYVIDIIMAGDGETPFFDDLLS